MARSQNRNAYDLTADAQRVTLVAADGTAADAISAGTNWSYVPPTSGISNTTTAVTIKAAAGAGVRNFLTGLQVSAGALGAGTEVVVRSGAGGTVIWRGVLGTAGGDLATTFNPPLASAANTLLEVATLTATVTGSVYINAQGYTGA